MTGEATFVDQPAMEHALAVVSRLADEIGGRRPTSPSERAAAEVVVDDLRASGLDAIAEPFPGYPSFGYPYGVIAALAGAPALLPRRWRRARGALATVAAAAFAAEGSLVHTPLSRLLSRAESRNVTATIEPHGVVQRTLCLMAHLDTSRSGLLFDPRFAGVLNRWIALQSVATLILPAEPLLARTGPGRALLAAARSVCVLGLALLVERELRGVDVPGANDNASGVGVAVQLAAEVVAAPLESTRLVVLVNGCEESGLLGAQAYLRNNDTSSWLFLNFDGVGAPATLRYLPSEGLLRKWAADRALVTVAERIRSEHPELGLEPADGPIGLTYDATAVLARGGRALTLVAGDGGRIPNYHQPTDTVDHLDTATLARAIGVGRRMIAAIDGGQADR